MTSTNIPGLETFINAMITLAITIGLLVIFLTMYTTVIERTRDIGVLKSLGANQWFVVRALLSESAALCLFGVAAGVGLSYAVRAGFICGIPDADDSDHFWMGFASSGHRASRGVLRRELPGMDGQPQGRR